MTARDQDVGRLSDAVTKVLLGGRVLSMDSGRPEATSLAWRGGTLVAVGDERHVLEASGPAPEVVMLDGRVVIPGLTDAHAHLDRHELGADLLGFEDCTSRSDVLAQIARKVSATAAGEWIVTRPIGRPPSYAAARLGAGSLVPTRAELDEVAPDNPVYIRPIWGYWNPAADLVSVANTAALAAAGLDPERIVPPSRSVELQRDERGRFTGVFVERTRSPIVEHTLLSAAPSFSASQRTAAIAAGWKAYAAFGTTAYFEGHGVADELLDAYCGSGASPLRGEFVWSPDWTREDTDCLPQSVVTRRGLLAQRQSRLDLSGLFVEFDDGSGDAQIRCRRETGWAGFSAGAALAPGKVRRTLLSAARAGLRVSGIDIRLLPLIEEVDRQVPVAPLRWVLGHVPVLSPAQIDVVARLGMVVTTIAPYFLHRMGDALARDPGSSGSILPLRQLLAAGVPFAFGSDNVPISLWESLWVVTERRSESGSVVDPQNALSREEALRAATWGGAYLMRQEGERGVLKAGMAADFVVLDDDPLTCDAAVLRQLSAKTTVVAGQVVHEAL